MKRTLHINYLSAIAAAAMTSVALTACRDNIGANGADGQDADLRDALLIATISEPQSRTNYTDDGTSYSSGGKVKVTWSADDSIRLYKADNGVGADTITFQLSSGADSKKGGFSLKWDKAQNPNSGLLNASLKYSPTVKYKAIYPAPIDEFNRTKEAQNLTAVDFLNSPSNTPQMQTGGSNTMDHLCQYDMMTAVKSPNDKNLNFEHQVAVLRIVLHFDMKAGGSSAIDVHAGAKARMVSIKGPKALGNKTYQIAIPDDKAPVMNPGSSTVAFYLTVPPFIAQAGEEMEIQTMLYKKLNPPKYDPTDGKTVIQTGYLITLTDKHKFTAQQSFDKGCIYEIKQLAGNVLSDIPVIDMGGGQIWATRNIGAKDPYDDGHYFQWAETNGWEYNGPLMIYKGWDKDNDREIYVATNNTKISKADCKIRDFTNQQLLNIGFRSITAHRMGKASSWGATHGGDSLMFNIPDYQGCLINRGNRTYTPVTRTYTETDLTNVQLYGTNNDGHSYFPIYNHNNKWVLRSTGGVAGKDAAQGSTLPWYNFHHIYTGKRYVLNQTAGSAVTEPYMVGDAATYQWGDAWHMPTLNQFCEMVISTTMQNDYTNKEDFYNPNGSGSRYRRYVKTNDEGKVVELILPNCFGWDEDVNHGNVFGWFDVTSDGNNYAKASVRLQTTTSAKGLDAYFTQAHLRDATEFHCWEYHFRWMNGAAGTTFNVYDYSDWNKATLGDKTFKNGMHSHHYRETAVPIRPILKLEPDMNEFTFN